MVAVGKITQKRGLLFFKYTLNMKAKVLILEFSEGIINSPVEFGDESSRPLIMWLLKNLKPWFRLHFT